MRNKVLMILIILTVLLGAGIVLTGTAPHASAEGDVEDMQKVEIWKRTDIVLISEKTYANPYKEVEIDADFIHEDGTKIHLFGFWNGGDEWRVRFSPTKTGVWTYTVTCNDTDNSVLHGATGKVLAVENTGTTDIDKHGFVKISDNGRYFVHDDGTPFYWLGDTNWQAPNYVSMTQCNYPGCDCQNQFTHEVNDRLAKGFTVYQTYFDSGEGDGGGQRGVNKEPSMWRSKYSRINTDTFTNKIDVMFDYLADHGMVIALGYGVHSSTVKSMPLKDLERLSRYLTARYASYPVIWITAQEITGEEHFDAWVDSARIVSEGDGYDHPQGAHMYPLPVDNEFVVKLDAESWHQYYALQCGHGPTITTKALYKSYWDNTRSGKIKPFVETEANYEDISCGGFNGYEASRISAWKANLCGSYGFTYGVTGVWANCYSTAGNTGWMGTFSYEPWYMGIDKPGSFEMKYLVEFFKYVDFSRLVPRFNDEAYSDLKEETKVVASSDSADTYVAYFYNSNLSTGELRGLDTKKTYSAKWYDPITGRFVVISDIISAKSGKYTIPEKPNGGDWVLLVTSRTDLGGFKVEKAYTDKLIEAAASVMEKFTAVKGDANANILTGSDVSASSYSHKSSGPEMSIDGRTDTWWCAKDGSFPQYLMFKLPEPREFNTFAFGLYMRSSGASYVLEGSNNGENWDELAVRDATPEMYGDMPVFICTLAKNVTYRYIRLTFNRVTGNWAAVLEAAAYIDEIPDVNTVLPEYRGSMCVPEVKCSGSYVYTAKGEGSDSIDALFDNDPQTVWKPFAPIGSQTILMDMGERKSVYGINITPGENAVIPRYRIEGSSDGETWTILADATLRRPEVYYPDGIRVISEALEGAYRYVKLLWLGGGGNEVDKTISGIALYAGDASEWDDTHEPEEVYVEVGGEEERKTDASKVILPVAISAGAVLAAGLAAGLIVRSRKNKKGISK